ncbi:hypothetical protein BN14_09067 [Rhizoctonia solani AG-1 IB]|uniref:Peptidase C14 caspase domain-containing protein n=1 Tax=Thanatephorus cucumeris (strain AG1-IB / isolate 7/3/14) TaxID=1108050 RepID=M5C6B6_THACB|nr:hypothetical protein BN14_09067 [Rhizoctonia solani AG-1 IB]
MMSSNSRTTNRLNAGALFEKLCEKAAAGTENQSSQKANKFETITKPTGAKPPLHALIIGINKYKANVPLAAAVSDALAFKAYLTDDLSVPEDQITIILDDQAKRADIIKAFQDLAEPDNGIARDDPIVIYYAGYGGEIDPPQESAANGRLVQCIIPQDTSKDTRVVPIPDFTIGALVQQIVQEKGNNITLIFDCCYSAGASQETPEDARYIDKSNLPSLPTSCDDDIIQDIISPFGDVFDPFSLGFSYEDMDSHVILTACGYGEVALENGTEKYGYFSNALLKLLHSIQIDSLTYKDCIRRLPTLCTKLPQNPICEGRNTDRLFFNAKVQNANISYIPIQPKGNDYYLQAGLIQGITPGDKYSVHASDVPGPSNPSLGTLEIERVEPFVARLKDANKMDLPGVCYGRQVGYGPNQALNIYITEEFVDATQLSSWPASAFTGGMDELVLRPAEPELASVILSVDAAKKTTFTLANQALVHYGIDALPGPDYPPTSPKAEIVLPILIGLSQWNWHLRRIPESRPFQRMIDFEFFKLRNTGKYADEGFPILVPEGNNLSVNGVVDIVASLRDFYGIKVVNRYARNLYVYLLNFSGQTPTIEQRNIPGLDGSLSDPILLGNTSLTIGYGPEGQLPFMFEVSEGQNIDVNFFKLFVSTHPANFSSVEQHDPFGGHRCLPPVSKLEGGFGEDAVWDAFTMVVVQRRYPKGRASPPKDTTGDPPAPEYASKPLANITPVPTPKSNQKGNTQFTPAPKLTPGFKSAVGFGDLVLFTGRSEEPLSVRGRSANQTAQPWFRTPKLTQELIDSLCGMMLRTYSKQLCPAQGVANTENGSYFEISVIGSDELPKLSPDETEMVYRSHSAPSASDYEWTNGVVFDEDHELWIKQLPTRDK